MTKFALWVSVLANVAFAGACAYQAATIQHLQFVIKLILGGNPN